jgi:hypothetical protein
MIKANYLPNGGEKGYQLKDWKKEREAFWQEGII